MSKLRRVHPFIIVLIIVLTVCQRLVFSSDLEWGMKILLFIMSFGLILIMSLFEFLRLEEEDGLKGR